MRRLAVLWLPFVLSCSLQSSAMEDAGNPGTTGADEALVVFYRPAVTGNTSVFPIFADGRLAGYSEKRCYFEVRCEPGEHVFRSPGVPGLFGATDDAVVTAELAAGKTYFIEAYASGGGCDHAYVPGLRPVTRSDPRWGRVERKASHLQARRLRDGQAAPSKQEEREFKEAVEKGSRLVSEDGR
jgi:hypothetical protein